MITILAWAAASIAAPNIAQPAGCAPLPGVEALIARPGINYLLIGEYHGTAEMPVIAADALCAVAATGRHAILGVEFPPNAQPYLDAFLKSDGGDEARAALLAAPVWTEEGGRTTAAILEMIDAARRLAKAGRPVTVTAFDRVPEPIVSKEREEGLAAGLAAAHAATPGSLVVALTGLAHADKQGWTSRTPPFPAAGGILPKGETVSLAFARPGGQYWACQREGDGPRICAAYDMPVREPVAARGITLDPALRGGFDGIYSVGGAYTASKPALAGKE